MNRQIFLNLPVVDLSGSTAFFNSPGFPLDPKFNGEGAACVVISDTIPVMPASHRKFREFTPRPSATRPRRWRC